MELSNSERQIILDFFPEGLIAIDLETTGLSPLVDRIIEIAAIKISKNGVETFTTLIDPEMLIPPKTIAIHQISDLMVLGKPKLEDILIDLKSFLADLPIVAHNSKFDLGFMVMGFLRSKIPLSSSPIYCSCKTARSTHKEMPNHKLQTLIKEFNIPIKNQHRAFDDAFASLLVFAKSLERLKERFKDQEKNILAIGFVFSLDQFDQKKLEQLPSHLEELKKLVKEEAVIEIFYKGGSHKNSFRPVKLCSLMNTPDGNILYARCLLSDIYKSFKLNKISDIKKPSALEIQQWLSKFKKGPSTV